MKKTIFVLVVVGIVAAVLAAGAAFIMQQNKNNRIAREAAQALEKMQNGEYSDAIAKLRLLEPEDHSGATTFLLGKAFYENGSPQEAIRYFNKIETEYARSRYLPEALLYKGRFAQEAEGQVKKAKEYFLQIIEKFPEAEVADFALNYLSRISYDEGDVAQAKKNLDIIMKRPESPARSEAEFLLGDINMKQLKSPEPGPGDQMYTIQRGDSIWKLERQLKVPGDLIVGINNLNPKRLSVGQQIKVPQLKPSLVVDKTQRTLTLRNGNAFLKKYRVGISSTEKRVPAGEYRVAEKYEKGYEYVDPETGTSIKPGDPANPLGTRFLQLRRDIGIHGTNDPEQVGKYVSKGTIALKNEDVEELYSLVGKDTPVTIKGNNLVDGGPSASK